MSFVASMLDILEPGIRAISFVGKPEPKIKSYDWYRIRELHKPGDILLSTENWRLSNLFIPGVWSHAAFVEEKERVLEAKPPVVMQVDLAEFVLTKDAICLLRWRGPINYIPKYIDEIADDYDHTLLAKAGTWYCSRLVQQRLQDCGAKSNLGNTRFGIHTVTPQDFYNARDFKFDVIYERLN